MANEAKNETKPNADAKPKKESKVKRSEWVENGKVSTRTVETTTRGKVPISYVEMKLAKDVTDPQAAAKLLELTGHRIISAMQIGRNRLARKKAAGAASLLASVAEHKGISLEEARKLLG